MLANLRDERKITIMISSHILEELGKLADCYGIINNGRLIDEFTKDELHTKSTRRTCLITDSNSKALTVINNSGLTQAELSPDGSRLIVNEELSPEKNIVKLLVNNDIFVKEVVGEEFSLEDYFLKVTGGGQENV